MRRKPVATSGGRGLSFRKQVFGDAMKAFVVREGRFGYTSQWRKWHVNEAGDYQCYCDAIHYFGGYFFGKKKLPVKASPNKSYAGLFSGILFSIAAVFLSEWIFKIHISFTLFQKIFIGIIFGFIVILSDLLESILKRSVVIKDSRGLFPGHGGVLDIFDGWFLTIPLFYFYIRYFVIWRKILLS